MTGRLLITFSLILSLAACETQWNPLNWFSDGRDDTIALVPEGGFPAEHDPRQIISQITDLQVQRNPGGAIIQVTGLPPRLGYWNAELVPENNEQPENGVLTYVFRISEPVGASASASASGSGSSYARKIFVAHFVSDNQLQGVRQIRVVGEQNSRTARR